ncbi:hypothetical protein [Shewanella algicola]|uniref:Uncharacterized protein n=1 Tax=Shewanella algicola TaxID=640633 RepID=A0A9X2CAP4_9GAMM|nr:hypothetical protein [Shewanella algicola]MCL1106330.1 hypothetical protein [Shewanella algicola]
MNIPNFFALITLMFIATSVQGQSMSDDSDWKLKLRYGKETTPYTHYTVLAEGVCGEMAEGFSCPKGNAIMGIKVWATDIDEPPYMVKSIGSQIGFEVTGEIQIYATEPEEPPRENPHGYDIQFTPFD